MGSRKLLTTFLLACLSIAVSKSILTEDDLTLILNSPLFQQWKVQLQEEIRKEILQDLEKTEVMRKLKTDVEENTCKIDEVIPYINETISNTCIEKSSKESVYVLVTGDLDENQNIEVVYPNLTSHVCQSNSNYPLDIRLATGSLLNKETVVICGGTSPITSACYSMGANMEWTNWQDMATKRRSHASIVTQRGIWVTGGFDGSNRLTTTEFLTRTSVYEGANLPEARRGHCIVQDGEKIFIIGGHHGPFNDQSSVWQFDASNDFSRTDVKSMNHGRGNHACGIFHSDAHSGRPVIVAAGSLSGDGMDSSEFWDYTQTGSKWQLTDKLPVEAYGAKMSTTSSGDGLIMTQNKGIYTFKCTSENSCSWTKEQQELKISRAYHVMLTVPSALMKNC